MPSRAPLALLFPLAIVSFAAPHKSVPTAAWNQPADPYRIAGNIYYVGTSGLASFLITTEEGHILINSSYAESVPLIRASVERLGFRFTDIKYLLLSHAHDDHAAGAFLVKELTGAKVLVMQGDDQVIATGGHADFFYGDRVYWKPCKIDRVLHDNDTVTLGGTTLTAHLTPGHTRGCTTWSAGAIDNGRKLNVVIVGSLSVNPGYQLAGKPSYPGIAEDYERSFRVLRSLACDIFLGPHSGMFGGPEKAARLKAGAKENPFLDPQGYRDYLDNSERNFRKTLTAQGGKTQ
jgi:metallo-beta-lactamase class B